MQWQQGNTLRECYCLLRRLGSYGNRQTWLAYDVQSGKRVIVKALLFAPDERLWQEQRLIEREAQTIASISHPAIPRFCEQFDLTESEGTYTCLILEYIPGESLTQVVRRDCALSIEQVKQLAIEVLAVLETLHSFVPPVIHRDIKPDNLILREEDGRVCLVDFGSVQAQFEVGRTMTVVGTYGYMPPEQFAGLSSPASDLYGLGATVLFALSGQDPADWPRRGPYIDLRTVPNESMRIWLGRMLDPDPACRFANARSARAALLQPGTLETEPETPYLPDVRLRISLSPDCKQMEIRSTNESISLNDLTWLTVMTLGATAGFCLALSEIASSKLVGVVATIFVPLALMIASSFIVRLRSMPWQWKLVASAKSKLLLRTFFGRVVQSYTLPPSLQVATAEEDMPDKKPSKFSVALVTPDGRRYLLGNWYNKLEAQQLANFLREWLEENS
ncbi:MAG: serine/threonine protein kinase [Anaerolineae bacterium]|nr:serine/threonine protein kinase [Gloeobacterales cyanobacterium ES-bin-313]